MELTYEEIELIDRIMSSENNTDTVKDVIQMVLEERRESHGTATTSGDSPPGAP